MKTAELIGTALDWAVAVCEGATDFRHDTVATYWVTINGKDRALAKNWAQSFTPSVDWTQGGPIIEREKIALTPSFSGSAWVAHLPMKPISKQCCSGGLTPLIVAMRCYVACKLGDEIEIPEELT